MCLHALSYNWTLLERIDICHITVILAANNCHHLSAANNYTIMGMQTQPAINTVCLCVLSLTHFSHFLCALIGHYLSVSPHLPLCLSSHPPLFFAHFPLKDPFSIKGSPGLPMVLESPAKSS